MTFLLFLFLGLNRFQVRWSTSVGVNVSVVLCLCLRSEVRGQESDNRAAEFPLSSRRWHQSVSTDFHSWANTVGLRQFTGL